MILVKSLSFEEDLVKISQSGWLGAPIRLSLSLFEELGINLINDQGSF